MILEIFTASSIRSGHHVHACHGRGASLIGVRGLVTIETFEVLGGQSSRNLCCRRLCLSFGFVGSWSCDALTHECEVGIHPLPLLVQTIERH